MLHLVGLRYSLELGSWLRSFYVLTDVALKRSVPNATLSFF